MHIRLQHKLREEIYQADQLVVYDIDGEPIAVVLEPVPGYYELAQLGDPDFDQLLRRAGAQNSITVARLPADKLIPGNDVRLP